MREAYTLRNPVGVPKVREAPAVKSRRSSLEIVYRILKAVEAVKGYAAMTSLFND